MSKILEIHVLQNLAPGNLNRDDTGAPKDAVFGGVRRARISSQSIKRAVRQHFGSRRLIGDEQLAVRTRNLLSEVVPRLEAQGVRDAERAVESALSLIDLSIKKKAKAEAGLGQTEYLLFLAKGEIAALESAILEHKEEFLSGKPKAAAKNAIEACIGSARAVDIALFGRMVADNRNFNVDAACQVAHALSTNKVDREFDFFTAVDDRPREGEAVSGMLGTVEFNSACYYRYAVIHLDKFLHNLGGTDTEAFEAGVAAFVQAFVEALPTGKQNSFAAHNPPDFVAVRLRDGMAINLANAFERPVRAESLSALTSVSVDRLKERWHTYAAAYGGAGVTAVLDLTGRWGQTDAVGSLEDLLARVRQAVVNHLRED